VTEPPKAAEEKKPEETPTPPADLGQKVLSVEEVRVESVEDEPGKLTISVIGSVNSTGWSYPELRMRSPQTGDGTLTFDFFAQPPAPNDIVVHVLKKVHFTFTVDKPAGYKEVKVVARTNSMTAK